MRQIKLSYVIYAVAVSLLLTGCADVTPIEACTTVEPYGFLSGLWHGIISPISFLGSLLSDDIAMYAVNNNGGFYDLGFVLGAGILFRTSSRERAHKRNVRRFYN